MGVLDSPVFGQVSLFRLIINMGKCGAHEESAQYLTEVILGIPSTGDTGEMFVGN